MNRGRHHNRMDKIAILAKKHGAQYPKLWSKYITYDALVSLVKNQKYFCNFNNLHIFETYRYTSASRSEGGFDWSITKEGHNYWCNTLSNLYYGINNKIKQIKCKLNYEQ